jgi:hypothetical protein
MDSCAAADKSPSLHWTRLLLSGRTAWYKTRMHVSHTTWWVHYTVDIGFTATPWVYRNFWTISGWMFGPRPVSGRLVFRARISTPRPASPPALPLVSPPFLTRITIYATPDLLLKHLDVTLATYVSKQMKHLKYASEIHEKDLKTIANIRNIQIKHLQHRCETYATYR